MRLAGLGPGMRVLDVGCGTGDVSFLAVRLEVEIDTSTDWLRQENVTSWGTKLV